MSYTYNIKQQRSGTMKESIVEDERKPLTSIEWTLLAMLNSEISCLKNKERRSNEEQVVLDWMKNRVDSLEFRKKKQ
jgi:hypothetical protein